MEYERDLRLVHHDDDSVAGEAFVRLWARVDGALTRMLVASGQSPDDAADNLQTIRMRLWERRTSLDLGSPGAWWALVRTASKNLAIDHARAKRALYTALEESAEIPSWDMPYIDAIVVVAQDLRRLYDAADELWLGATEADDVALLGVQLCLLEGLDPADMASMLGVGSEELSRWIHDPTVLRRLAYRELFWNNDKLTGYVLRPSAPYTPSQIDELGRKARIRAGERPEEWEWQEVLVILLRLRNGLLSKQILRFEGCAMDGQSLDRILSRIRARFPFEEVVAELRDYGMGDAALSETGLWRRLAFQYHASSELPKRQVLERTEPAASVVGVKLTVAMLNNWIDHGRLWSQLAAHVQQGEVL